MKSNTTEGEVVFDVGSLYAYLQELKDGRKPRGIRYPLIAILVLMVMAKLCGEDTPSGMADWVKHRAEQFVDMLKLKRKTMPHHSTYRRVEAAVIDPEELEQVVSTVLAGRKFFGKQVLLSIDGKVLRGTLDAVQNGIYLLAAYLQQVFQLERRFISPRQVSFTSKSFMESPACPETRSHPNNYSKRSVPIRVLKMAYITVAMSLYAKTVPV